MCTQMPRRFARVAVAPGSPVLNPLDLFSQNGVLNVDLMLQNQKEDDGYMHYCYIYMYQGQPVEAPTLRMNPGDQLILNLTDNILAPYDRYGGGAQASHGGDARYGDASAWPSRRTTVQWTAR